MKLEIYCSMCGKEKEIPIKSEVVGAEMTLQRVVAGTGWITQQNGQSFDIYCSKKCAE
jgi:hypothetical protein